MNHLNIFSEGIFLKWSFSRECYNIMWLFLPRVLSRGCSGNIRCFSASSSSLSPSLKLEESDGDIDRSMETEEEDGVDDEEDKEVWCFM